jgi:hypothetical protein
VIIYLATGGYMIIKTYTDNTIIISSIDNEIDEALGIEEKEIDEKYKASRELLRKYLKITKYTKLKDYYKSTEYGLMPISWHDIDNNSQREKRIGYISMLLKMGINKEKLDKFIQKGCLGDLKYFDRILFMIDAYFLDESDIIGALENEEALPIIDPSIKLSRHGNKDYRFGTYCENQRDSLKERLYKKTI